MSNKVCTNFKDSNGNDLGCRFITKEDAMDMIPQLSENNMSDNLVWGAGDNSNYEMGQGTSVTTHQSVPVLMTGCSRIFTCIRGGLDQVYALDRNGNVWGWGANAYGQVGDGTTVTKSCPVLVSGTGGFAAIAGGRDFFLGVKHTGTLWAFGRGLGGVLGDGTTTNKSTPIQIGALTCWKSVHSGSAGYNAGGITQDGKLFRWGVNSTGLIGDGTTVNKSSPVQVGAGTDWKYQTNGHAIKTNGTLWGIGGNDQGQIGDGTTTNRSSPVQIGSETTWSKVFSASSTAAIKTDGTLWTWGFNSSCQLGDGTTAPRSSPVQVGTATNWKDITASRCSFFALKTDGTIWGWGNNARGQLGDGTTVNKSTPIQIACSSNDVYKIGQGDFSLFWFREPDFLCSYRETGFTSCGTDIDNYFVRREHFICSGAMSWGKNTAGQLGNLSTVNKSSPVQLCKTGTVWKQISTACNFATGIQTNATIWSWGCNNVGQLGDGTTVNKSTPIQIGALFWQQVASGVFASIAVRCDGALFSWGCNNVGQLGDGSTTNRSSPVQIGTGLDWKCVSYTQKFVVALKRNGTLWTWGCNVNGQLGDGTTVNKSSPVQVGTETCWKCISAGSDHMIAQKCDYTLWGTGVNSCNLLMTDGATTTCYSTPVQLNGGSALWRKFCVGGGSIFMGIKCDSSLWGNGSNDLGQLGDGTTTGKSSPIQISACGWKDISTTYKHTAAIKTDGSLWAWGCNTSGELGDGTTTSRCSPVQVGASCYWTSVKVFNQLTIALREEC